MAELHEGRYTTTDEYNRLKQEAIVAADEARFERIKRAADRLRGTPLDVVEVANPVIDGIPVTKLMQPEVHGGRTSNGRATVRSDYDGDLGGGVPKNPLRIPGIIH